MKKLLNHRLFLINSWSFDLVYVCETVFDIKDSKVLLYLSVYFTLSVDILTKQIFSFKFIKCLIQFSIKYCSYYQKDRILITYTSLRNSNYDKDIDSSFWHRRNADKSWSCAIQPNKNQCRRCPGRGTITRHSHYENIPIQIYWKFYNQKNENFQIKKKSDIFHISAQSIDCGYSLEPPRRGGSNEYPQSMFLSRNTKNNE